MEDLIGKKIGRLTVISYSHKDKWRKHHWNCICECGNNTTIKNYALKNKTKSCGCLQKEKARESNTVDMIGKKFNRLTIISFSHHDKGRRCHWNCLCDCGNSKVVEGNAVRSGKIKSCGCLNSEMSSERAKSKFEDLTGKVFGLLTVISLSEKIYKTTNNYWNCICECGNGHVVKGSHLKSGGIKSCGCLTKGENNNMYNHDLTDEERNERRNCPQYYQWRKNVLNRDKYKCQCCGNDTKTLNTHHIYNYKDYKQLRYETHNGIVLCEDCHIEFHNLFERRYNDLNQLICFFNRKKVDIPKWLKNAIFDLVEN